MHPGNGNRERRKDIILTIRCKQEIGHDSTLSGKDDMRLTQTDRGFRNPPAHPEDIGESSRFLGENYPEMV